jgi:hypothetical protein
MFHPPTTGGRVIWLQPAPLQSQSHSSSQVPSMYWPNCPRGISTNACGKDSRKPALGPPHHADSNSNFFPAILSGDVTNEEK